MKDPLCDNVHFNMYLDNEILSKWINVGKRVFEARFDPVLTAISVTDRDLNRDKNHSAYMGLVHCLSLNLGVTMCIVRGYIVYWELNVAVKCA